MNLNDLTCCTLFPTLKECWCNFNLKGSRDFSDFEVWAIYEAWKKIVGIDYNYWLDGEIHSNRDEDDECITLGLTFNGILVLKVFDLSDGGCEQTEQYVVKIEEY